MKDLRVEIKIKNNLLFSRMKESGFSTVAEFSRALNVTNQMGIGELLSFKRSPITKHNPNNKLKPIDGLGGEFYWRKLVVRISNLLKCEPEDLFPEHLQKIRQSFYALEMESAKILAGMEEHKSLEETILEEKERPEFIQKALASLTPKEEKVIRMRYGLDFDKEGEESTLKEVAHNFDCSVERVRQVESKALRKLRHPSISRHLREVL